MKTNCVSNACDQGPTGGCRSGRGFSRPTDRMRCCFVIVMWRSKSGNPAARKQTVGRSSIMFQYFDYAESRDSRS